MREITVYNAASGAVLYSCEVEPDAEIRVMPGEAWTNGRIDGATHWVNPETGRANKRRPMPTRAAANALSRVPEGAVLVQDGEAFSLDSDALVFEPDLGLSQDVQVEILHPRFLSAALAVPIDGTAVDAGESVTRRAIKQDYAALRAQAYPAEREQVGALVKAVKALMAGEDVPAEALAVIAEVDAVKDQFPKSAPPG